MVDTMVLVYATTSDPSPDMAKEVSASVALINSLKAVRVSAIAWMEYLRGSIKNDPKKFADLQDKVFVDPFDGRAALVAAELLQKHKATPAVCFKCLNPTKGPVPCPKCGLHVPKNFRLNDAMVFAERQ